MKKIRYQIILSIFMGIIVAYSFFFLVDNRSSQYTIISPLAEAKDMNLAITDRHPTISIKPLKTSLHTILTNILSKEKGTYSVVVKNLVTNDVVNIHEHIKMEPGSLYKLWVMAAVMEKLEKGDITENQSLSDSVENINAAFKIDPESAELTEGFVNFTVKTALEQMITISHNYAALILAKKIRLATVDSFLSEYSFDDSLIGQPPQTTAADISLFLEKLYKKELVTQERSTEMLDLLKRQKLNNKLPKYLPKETVIAHKTGEIGTFSHDAGIVYTKHGPYIIVIFSDSDIPKEAEETIARLSQATYAFFEGD